jgi:hypothetical protein
MRALKCRLRIKMSRRTLDLALKALVHTGCRRINIKVMRNSLVLAGRVEAAGSPRNRWLSKIIMTILMISRFNYN